MPIGVDASGHQGVHPHHPAALADLEHQGVGGNERLGAGVQRPVTELGDLLIEVAGHLRDLRLAQPAAGHVPTRSETGVGQAEQGSEDAQLRLTGAGIQRTELARLGQRIENEIIGLRSGIMDQVAIACEAAGSALLIDCRTWKPNRSRCPPASAFSCSTAPSPAPWPNRPTTPDAPSVKPPCTGCRTSPRGCARCATSPRTCSPST